jgi:hypothetical protein
LDINSDGKKEYIVADRNDCGSAGCPVAIVGTDGSGYMEIFEYFDFCILTTRTKGFRDILVHYKGPDFTDEKPAEIYKWNGREYVLAGKRPQTGPAPKGIWTNSLYGE